MNLIMLCYNFMRTKNILGYEKMFEAIKNWQPDYSKVVCLFKKRFIRPFYSPIRPAFFTRNYLLPFCKAA